MSLTAMGDYDGWSDEPYGSAPSRTPRDLLERAKYEKTMLGYAGRVISESYGGSGALLGATLGSAAPGIGSVIGAGLGGFFGTVVGGVYGDAAKDHVSNAYNINERISALESFASAVNNRDIKEIDNALEKMKTAGATPEEIQQAHAIADHVKAETADIAANDGGPDPTKIDPISPRPRPDLTEGSGPPQAAERPRARPEYERPVILDLDDDGIEMVYGPAVSFDIDGDGFKEVGSWVGKDDGFLVIDLAADGSRGTGDGKITMSKEISFAEWTSADDTDLEALGSFDSNKDGKITKADDIWDELRVWRDFDTDGETDSGELVTLASLGLTQINYKYDTGSYDDTSDDLKAYGSTLHGSASFIRNGKVFKGAVGDVTLGFDGNGWRERIEGDEHYINFETGDKFSYYDTDKATSADVNLDSRALDGAYGDERANLLDATGHSRTVFLTGDSANDTLRGGDNDDLLSGDAGTDALYGNGGNDLLFVDKEDLAGGKVYGGDGIDTLIVADDDGVTVDLLGRQVEVAVGDEGNDALNGGDVADDLRLYGRGGDDTLRGSDGDDILSGDGGNDTLRGNSGDDTLAGDSGIDVLDGGDGDDLLMGGGSDDYLQGAAGDDRLLGGDHEDKLFGSSGDDNLQGESGNDRLDGGEGDDVLMAGSGNDTLVYWRGDDRLQGENGDDRFVMDNDGYGTRNHFGWAIFQGGKGSDTAELWGKKSEWTVKDLGDGQWQFYREVSGTEKVVLDLQDIEKVKFGGDGSTLSLNTDTSKDRSDDYERRNYNPYVGDSTATAGNVAYISGGVLKGWMGNDALTGAHHIQRSGNSTGYEYYLVDSDNDETIDGGSGRDDIDGYGGDDTLIGGSGSDRINGGRGNDQISGGSGADFLEGSNGNDRLEGNEGADVLAGGIDNDTLIGHDGSDDLDGGSGSDTLTGGSGSDRLYGGTGDDVLNGETGADDLYGNDGDDRLHGEAGSDRLSGGDGNDYLSGDDGFDILAGGDGNDTLEGEADDDWLIGDDGNDKLYGGSGRDVMLGGKGADLLDGGSGILDMISYEGSSSAVFVELFSGKAENGDAEGDTLTAIEQVFGSDHDDRLSGNTVDNVLIGGKGDDRLGGREGHDDLSGGDGEDRLSGDSGNDRLSGEAGDDTLIGGAGADRLDGDSGFDVASYESAASGVIANLSSDDENRGDAWGDTYSGIDGLRGSGYGDMLTGSRHDNTMWGGGGHDKLYGADGDDRLRGGTGGDLLDGGSGYDTADYSEASDGVVADIAAIDSNSGEADGDSYISIESIRGSQFNDSLRGNAGGNRLWGGDGDDIFRGREGDDTLEGGDGADTFVFDTGWDKDRVIDFRNDVDQIRFDVDGYTTVSSVLAKAKEVSGDVIFDFGGGDILTIEHITKTSLSNDIYFG